MPFLVEFILVLTLDGRHVEINREQIVTLTESRDGNKLGADSIKCVITLADGKLVSVMERCASIRQRMEQLK